MELSNRQAGILQTLRDAGYTTLVVGDIVRATSTGIVVKLYLQGYETATITIMEAVADFPRPMGAAR